MNSSDSLNLISELNAGPGTDLPDMLAPPRVQKWSSKSWISYCRFILWWRRCWSLPVTNSTLIRLKTSVGSMSRTASFQVCAKIGITLCFVADIFLYCFGKFQHQLQACLQMILLFKNLMKWKHLRRLLSFFLFFMYLKTWSAVVCHSSLAVLFLSYRIYYCKKIPEFKKGSPWE